jgi:hypothetical protein
MGEPTIVLRRCSPFEADFLGDRLGALSITP